MNRPLVIAWRNRTAHALCALASLIAAPEPIPAETVARANLARGMRDTLADILALPETIVR